MVSPNLTIENVVERTTDLPSMPDAALKVMRECDSPTGTAQNAASHLSRDQSLSAKILKLSNSSYYGLAGQVCDLQQAVIVLGMRSVRNLAVVASTYPWLSQPLKGYALAPGALWDHSIAVAIGAQMLAKHTRSACPETAFTSGLLHDIGKVVLNVWLENKLEITLKYALRNDLPFDAAERKVIGFDHQQVGAYLAQKWGLPDVFVKAMAYHHQAANAPDFKNVVDCVHLADYFTMSVGYGLGGDGMRYIVDPNSFERLGLQNRDIDPLLDRYVEGVASFKAMLESLEEAA